MAELTTVTGGDTISTATFGNPVIDRVLSRYATEAARDIAVPVPVAGDLGYIIDIDEFQIYDGADWRHYLHPDATGAVTLPRPERLAGAIVAAVGQGTDAALTAGVGVFQNYVTMSNFGIGPTSEALGVLLFASGIIDVSVAAPTLWTARIRNVTDGVTVAKAEVKSSVTDTMSFAVNGWGPDIKVYALDVSRDATAGTQLVQEPKLMQVPVLAGQLQFP